MRKSKKDGELSTYLPKKRKEREEDGRSNQ